MANQDTASSKYFVFDLHLVAGGYAYYSTITQWTHTGEHGRQKRQPVCIDVSKMNKGLEMFGQGAFFLQSEDDYEYWIRRRGWAFAPMLFVRTFMPQWIKEHYCIEDAANTFTAVCIASEGTLTHKVCKTKRNKIEKRDGKRCLLCGRTRADGIPLTMHHVTPYCRGGENTTRNLICLCSECNNRVGAEELTHLYELAGLPHSYDLGLLNGEVTEEALEWAVVISDNLMHTRCDIY